jgi:hypothetical protein
VEVVHEGGRDRVVQVEQFRWGCEADIVLVVSVRGGEGKSEGVDIGVAAGFGRREVGIEDRKWDDGGARGRQSISS